MNKIIPYIEQKVSQLILPSLIVGLIVMTGLTGFFYGQNITIKRTTQFLPSIEKMNLHMLDMERNGCYNLRKGG